MDLNDKEGKTFLANFEQNKKRATGTFQLIEKTEVELEGETKEAYLIKKEKPFYPNDLYADYEGKETTGRDPFIVLPEWFQAKHNEGISITWLG